MTDPQTKAHQPSSAKGTVDDEIDLLDYLRVVRRYRWMILVLCVVAMTLAVVVTRMTPRRYQASVTIVPPLDILQKESGGGFGSLNSPLLRQAISSVASSITDIYVEILESREVADSIIDRFHLMDTYKKVRYRSDARRQLQKNTSIKPTDGGAVKITVTDTDPNRSAAMANAYVEELDRQNKRLSAGQATSKRVFLENRLKEVEAKLSKIDNILSREAKTQEMLYDLLVTQYEMAKIEEAKSMPTIQVLDEAVVPELPAGRGTIRKGMMAGLAAFMFGIFLAFSREYVTQARRREQDRIRAGTEDVPPGGSKALPSRKQALQNVPSPAEIVADRG